MKTLIITISTLAIMFNSYTDNNAKTVSDTNTLNQIEQTQSENCSIQVSACNYKGEIIPSVQLPTFNVIGVKSETTKLATTMYKNELIPLVILPELKIIS